MLAPPRAKGKHAPCEAVLTILREHRDLSHDRLAVEAAIWKSNGDSKAAVALLRSLVVHKPAEPQQPSQPQIQQTQTHEEEEEEEEEEQQQQQQQQQPQQQQEQEQEEKDEEEGEEEEE